MWIAVIAGACIILIITLLFLLRATTNGTSLPLFRGLRMRRWVEPRDTVTCQRIVDDMRRVCVESVGSVPTHPMLHGDMEALGKRIVMIIYHHHKPVMFNAILKVDGIVGYEVPIFHVGLVMVVNQMKRKGLQKITILNVLLLFLNYRITTFDLTDAGRSASGLRLANDYLDNPYPNYRKPDLTPSSEQVLVAKHVILKHKPDLGVGPAISLNVKSFELENALTEEEGSAQSVYTIKDGRSKNDEINTFLMARVGDRQFVGLFCTGKAKLTSLILSVGARFIKRERI
ncbi:uncharacterized protein LOC106150793 [Lingula anatina]|uniref:Uncharacterized protein LOC106150793 n=1 Tax=Lingula anatina TaxID=7574 RepID=A0A1S3GZR0_LINAN|nr:uncharacterized protein LOC106150793 [Lingula anatina]|eukprot:XP_013379238.1 uncharacterized protein LOC106150793 [Lingula anatina]